MPVISASSKELRAAIDAGSISVREATERAVAMRNQIMELARRRSSPTARAYATRLKREGRSVADLSEKYAQRLYHSTFSELSEQRQVGAFKEIIQAAGWPDDAVMRLAEQLERGGRRLLLVSLAVAVYEVVEFDNRPRELARQSILVGAGVVGGWAAGSAAVATGVCVATAPVCVGALVFVGGVLAAYGADAGFDSLYSPVVR
ncbi:hypothetical protein [Trinickia dinghuensis]|uniref:Uncharacterized protein n=1 Tax=Trinickia dinghuensis TaxID=2291023 RepID=A0A3D8K143_9BURK|nr:hypothetical protein [Trinickia dinghuensis]RDU99008.1 hypothetical protein DWV00_12295 [Trinickia dinghuensis]